MHSHHDEVLSWRWLKDGPCLNGEGVGGWEVGQTMSDLFLAVRGGRPEGDVCREHQPLWLSNYSRSRPPSPTFLGQPRILIGACGIAGKLCSRIHNLHKKRQGFKHLGGGYPPLLVALLLRNQQAHPLPPYFLISFFPISLEMPPKK